MGMTIGVSREEKVVYLPNRFDYLLRGISDYVDGVAWGNKEKRKEGEDYLRKAFRRS
jgi:hypothetical protein